MRRAMGFKSFVCSASLLLSFQGVLAAATPVEIARVGPEEVTDIDGDGLLDQLRVPIELDVAQAGIYVITAELRLAAATGAARRTRLSDSWIRKLDGGTEKTAATFSGPTLYETRHEGAYEIAVVVHRGDPMGRSAKALATRRYVTRPYARSEFAPERTFCIVDGVVVRDLSQCPSGLEGRDE